MSNFQNIDLLSVGVAVAGMIILGSAVLYQNLNSLSNRVFFYLALTSSVWGMVNYASYQSIDPDIAFWLLRLVMFFAVWSTFFTYTFVYIFPGESVTFPFYYKWIIAPITCVTSFLSLTSFVFAKIDKLTPDGRILTVTNGSGIAIFGLTVLFLNFGSIVVLLQKIYKSTPEQRQPLKTVLLGLATMLSLITIFNFIFPAFFSNTKFIALGALFMLPFISFTSYAIFKQRLFNIKIIAAEILVFSLAIGMLLDVILTTATFARAFRFLIFILVLVIGVLLIRSVRNEVEQREQLELLSKQLEDANEKLKALDQARAEFITIASHQLRTPPATIKWYLSAIIEGDYGKVPAKTLVQLKRTQNTNNHLISLIEDMLNVSRIERGKMEFLFEPVNVEELARFSYEQLVPIAEDKKLKLSYVAPKKALPKVMVDKEKLRQVMNNLIDNALKYTKEGTVVASIFQEGDNIKFTVKDSGKGISKEDSDSIFQKYSRGKESVKQSAGLGLGLYVAKIIIDQHKGKIWAESEGEGKGSTFAFSIPINNGLKQTTLVDLTKDQMQKA